ncbi:hypothetical protein HHL16_11180 [Pseudoflavitalea sp. G-6-1-2]|uniref:hypothetical protein n=1 Tax=Pseudoflavitalea sp. G-6-1-2 TaxID=2728841 RepID=UPI00146A23C5|nr:hypothetical protein [Pseudoflavitalea sp. G-6-1-2]NML21441.1 hypothetical protein [Pseudoflavitalea sp. G-6-1-2]
MKRFSLLLALTFFALGNSFAQDKPAAPQRGPVSGPAQEHQLFKIFRGNGRFLVYAMVAHPDDLYQFLKRFGKGEYICVPMNTEEVAERRIIVY